MELATLAADAKTQRRSEASATRALELSVVVPISERRDDLRELYHRYAEELSAAGYTFECIFVLDGPDAELLQTLKALQQKHPEITVIILNRRFGEATALAVGFDRTTKPVILTLASYFQVEPGEIHRLLAELLKGEYDLVSAWRYPRIDSLFNRAQSKVFHWLIRLLTGMRYHDLSCGLRVMKRAIAEEIPLYGDLHRFLPLLAFQRGFKVGEIPTRQSRYDAGRRAYKPGVYLRRLLDILTIFFLFKFTKKPLRFFGLLGSGLLGAGAIITGYLGLYRLLGFGGIAGRPLLILGVLLIVFGFQLFSMGLLGEIIIFTHARDVRDYQIKEVLE